VSPSQLRRFLFGCFVLSGFSGLVYQIVWVRLALASFGVITPFASVVVSVFMLGLALGTWAGGRAIGPLSRRLGKSPLMVYALLEAVIGLGAFLIPPLFAGARALLLPMGGMESGLYLAASSGLIAVSLLPFCLAMGATFPAMMSFIETEDSEPSGSFSFLYLANVIGAFAGAVATPVFLIEWFGFSGSLQVGASLNWLVAMACLGVSVRFPHPAIASAPPPPSPLPPAARARELSPARIRGILFLTGFTTMALEIVWMRAFTPILGTLVYAFSGLLAVYLISTFMGSALYRRHRARGRVLGVVPLLFLLPVAALLPAWIAIPKFISGLANGLLPIAEFLFPGATVWLPMGALALLSIAPFCGALGYLTPMLIDHDAGGSPKRAGGAYAINIAGSILGPLCAAYILLPVLGARLGLLVLTLPLVGLCALSVRWLRPGRPRLMAAVAAGLTAAGFIQIGAYGRSFEEGSHIRHALVRRDHTATVISFGQGFNRHLLVNGYGMTVLTTLTKIMAHLPLASLDHPPKRALVIAFGMGTTFRSLLSWGIPATAVELVPSVVAAFDDYHDDAQAIRENLRAEIVIDDGRRFLARTDHRFDVITLDPPPPVETAGSSLLYAREFYALAQARLAPGGIVHQWFPDGIRVESVLREAVLRSAAAAFPHMRIYQSHHGFGLHILLSMEPIAVPNASRFIQNMPPEALSDLMEWAPVGSRPEKFIEEQVLGRELEPEQLMGPPIGPEISDDRPFNEYFILRRLGAGRGEP
jgi:spermidine synthase